MTDQDEQDREINSFKSKVIIGLIVIACLQIAVYVAFRIYRA